MKRFLHGGEGYAQDFLANRLKLHLTRYTNNPTCQKFGRLAYPSWVPKVTGIQFLVALFSTMLQYATGLTRIFLTAPSSPSPSVVEAQSKDCRSPLEGLSKRSRTTVEADSNNCRRSVEQLHCLWSG